MNIGSGRIKIGLAALWRVGKIFGKQRFFGILKDFLNDFSHPCQGKKIFFHAMRNFVGQFEPFSLFIFAREQKLKMASLVVGVYFFRGSIRYAWIFIFRCNFTVLSIWLSGHLLLFTAKYTNSLLAMFIVVCLLPFLFIISRRLYILVLAKFGLVKIYIQDD